ncbi:unnamed protein product [Penicillium egyptiacum]|uniref:Uncharacterized protein n=1 Tax=Penicillium egyptiacum TaxID=1303716 RepID=A0A9W4KCQ9_9EURO|nr:unnamed protein product [Penicillium egyptiacum]
MKFINTILASSLLLTGLALGAPQPGPDAEPHAEPLPVPELPHATAKAPAATAVSTTPTQASNASVAAPSAAVAPPGAAAVMPATNGRAKSSLLVVRSSSRAGIPPTR